MTTFVYVLLIRVQAWNKQCPSGEDKARTLLFVLDPNGKLFKVACVADFCFTTYVFPFSS